MMYLSDFMTQAHRQSSTVITVRWSYGSRIRFCAFFQRFSEWLIILPTSMFLAKTRYIIYLGTTSEESYIEQS